MPYSIVLHVLVLGLVILYGNFVQQVPIRTPRSIRVRMVQLPQLETVPQEKPAEEIPKPVVQPKPQETVPDLPAKELPKPRPEPEKKPEPKPVQKQPDPVETPVTEEPAQTADAVQEPAVGGPSVQGTDVDFPFAWYLARVQGQIARNWNPKQLGFRSSSVVSCVVHFTIHQNGRVSQVTLTRPSGVGVFDREALRVVQSSRIPPLPPGFSSSTLGVSMKFNLESGI